MASVINLNLWVVCNTRVHNSNRRMNCCLCLRSVHRDFIFSSEDIFYCNYCLAESLPFINLEDNQYYDQVGAAHYRIKQILTETDYPRLRLNPFNDYESKFVSDQFIDADTNHYNSLCNKTCEYRDADDSASHLRRSIDHVTQIDRLERSGAID